MQAILIADRFGGHTMYTLLIFSARATLMKFTCLNISEVTCYYIQRTSCHPCRWHHAVDLMVCDCGVSVEVFDPSQ